MRGGWEEYESGRARKTEEKGKTVSERTIIMD